MTGLIQRTFRQQLAERGYARTPDSAPNLRLWAEQLVSEATAQGMVITIERAPLKPLAMGHAEYVIDIREARKMAITS